ncbi:hypothetical protein [Amycolatopsis sp. cmx-4-54]|uniref:hypothetical protein n=1 Tax=Amycolatopsis sp. cmx-4-54 TaxID=2790936 RepID=UPI003978D1B8
MRYTGASAGPRRVPRTAFADSAPDRRPSASVMAAGSTLSTETTSITPASRRITSPGWTFCFDQRRKARSIVPAASPSRTVKERITVVTQSAGRRGVNVLSDDGSYSYSRSLVLVWTITAALNVQEAGCGDDFGPPGWSRRPCSA